MASFKTELHAHTSEVSKCANVSARDLVEMYIGAGYSTVVITDHMSRLTFPTVNKLRWKKYVEKYQKGYLAAKEAAGDRLNIIFGMELTFTENRNDYLVYGADADFILKHPDIMDMGIEKFSKLSRKSGLILVQAHPFRDGMTVTKPGLTDGIEVYNGHPGHDSRNEIAKHWAEKYSFPITTSGSDFHDPEHLGRAGIITDFEIKTNEELLRAVRGERTLITDETL